MRVLHIVAGDLTGGAARGAYWLHTGLKKQGVESTIFTNSVTTLNDDNVITTSRTKLDKLVKVLREQIDTSIAYLYRKRNKIIFSSGMVGVNFTKTAAYRDADIIHLHWINGGFVNMKHLAKIDKPIVWTMRDMWPMTGGCHVAQSIGCEQFKTGCGSCKQLNSQGKNDLSRIVLKRKKKYLPKHLEVVGISQWLSGEAKKSDLFQKFNVSTISNNIDTDAFFPVDKKIAKEILGISTDKKIILTGSTSLADPWKGFGKYLEAVKKLDPDKYLLCFFGNIDKKIVEPLGFEYKAFGFLHDNVSLRLVYSCADVFIAPSLMDAFGKTLAESMACGTPVVCFDATGPKDIVTHQKDGYKASPFDSDDLAAGTEWVVDAENYSELCLHAREKVEEQFSNVVVAKQYIDMYETMIERFDFA